MITHYLTNKSMRLRKICTMILKRSSKTYLQQWRRLAYASNVQKRDGRTENVLGCLCDWWSPTLQCFDTVGGWFDP